MTDDAVQKAKEWVNRPTIKVNENSVIEAIDLIKALLLIVEEKDREIEAHDGLNIANLKTLEENAKLRKVVDVAKNFTTYPSGSGGFNLLIEALRELEEGK